MNHMVHHLSSTFTGTDRNKWAGLITASHQTVRAVHSYKSGLLLKSTVDFP